MSEALWELSNVSLGRGRRLKEVTLTVPGGITAVIGPSGAGKTSLLNLLVGYERPDAGQVTRTGSVTADRLPIGWVPADLGLWPHLNVRQHLEVMLDERPNGTVEPIDRLLGAFGLLDLATSRVERLSQGERARLAVARALAGDPHVLVLDEPLVHVDPVHLDDYWRSIRNHCQTHETALVFSTHSPHAVLREAASVICLDDGRAVFSGTVETLYGSPPTRRLARFLGPANWFDSSDVPRWLDDRSPQASDLCLRPEQLDVLERPDTGLVIKSSVSAAQLTVSEVEDVRSQQVRTVYHRTPQRTLSAGVHVLLRICLLLLMCVIAPGCGQSSADSQLGVSGTRTIKVPNDGPRIPAARALTVSQDGELYVLDKAGRVLVYDKNGTLDRSWRMPDSDVGKPEGICVLKDGRIAVADTHYHRIVFFDAEGNVHGMFGELGEGPGQFIYPVSVTRDDSGHLYVAEYGGNDRLQKFAPSGEHLLTIGSFGTEVGQFQRPSGIVWCRNQIDGPEDPGTLYIADAINNRVQAFSDDGSFLGVIAGWAGGGAETEDAVLQPSSAPLDYPYDIAVGPNETLFIVEYGAGRVTAIDRQGQLFGRYGSVGRGERQFWTPWGIAVAADGRVFVADTGNKRIVELTL